MGNHGPMSVCLLEPFGAWPLTVVECGRQYIVKHTLFRWRHDLDMLYASLTLCLRGFPSQMVNHMGRWCFRYREEVIEQTIELPVIRGALALMWRHCNDSASTPTTMKITYYMIASPWEHVFDQSELVSSLIRMGMSSTLGTYVAIKLLANKRRRYIPKAFSHWLGPCTDNTKWSKPLDNSTPCT